MLYQQNISHFLEYFTITEELSETCTVLLQNKFEKLVYLVGFIIRTRGVPFNTVQPFTDLTVIAV